MKWFWRLWPHRHDDWMRLEDVKKLLAAMSGNNFAPNTKAKYECRHCGR